MSGYRFCRTDDIPLLVEAYNACFLPHEASQPALTVEAFKRGVRELNLWASSSMLALSGDEIVAVLLGAKRDAGNLVHSIAVRPGHERRGHGRHLVESLLRKVAILGPPRLAVELPLEAAGPRAFFEACGFAEEARFADFVAVTFGGDHAESSLAGLCEDPRATQSAEGEASDPSLRDLAMPATFDDLFEAGVLGELEARSWSRSLVTLKNRRAELTGLAVASDEQVEAFLLALPAATDGSVEIAALGATRGGKGAPLLGLLLRRLAVRSGRPLRLSRVSEDEVPASWLSQWGFRKECGYVGYAARAVA